MEDRSTKSIPGSRSRGNLPLVLGLTALVLVVPCLAAIGLRLTGLVTSPVLLILIPVVVSVAFSHLISELWKRRRSGSPLLFEDLMIWGWLRRRRFEKLLGQSERFVGPGAGEGLTTEQRAKELERLASALEARDPRTHGHSRRVARHATSIARRLNLTDVEVARIRTAALLHDVGKIEIPPEILEKPGALTDAEFEEVKKHPAAGARLVEGLGDPELAAIVRHHHERIDGAGYPDGLTRGQIPIGARIIAVADTFDALTSARSYRQPRSHEQALAILRDESDTQLDGRAVRAFDGRYSNRRPVALVAAALGLGRQAGQSLISFGTGASQVAAVGLAAAVIGAGPAIHQDAEGNSKQERQQVRGTAASAPGSAASTAPASAGTSRVQDDSTSRGLTTGAVGEGTNGSDGGQGQGGGTPGEGTPGDPDGGASGGGSGGSGAGQELPAGSPAQVGEAVKSVTETVQKPAAQVTETVTEAIPTLPGKDPVSEGVNEVTDGVKQTLGKLTGKP